MTSPDFESRKETHPLEGRHIVFKYTEADYDREYTFLLLYRIVNGELQGFTTPMHFGTDIPEDMDERTFQQLRNLGVEEVVTVEFSGNSFFGMELGTFDTLPEEYERKIKEGENPEEVEIENWSELQTIHPFDYYAVVLSEMGIALRCVDMRTPEDQEKARQSLEVINRFLFGWQEK